MMLGLIYNPDSAAYTPPVIPEITDSKQLWNLFAVELPTYMKEIALSLLPIVLFFAVFQALILKLSGRNLTRILIGLVYTYIGLVLFLTGVNVGFMPAGNYLGQVLTGVGGAFPSVGNCADCDGDGLLHRKSGACRLCPEQTG